MDYMIIGGAVNLAARLESSAEPGTILIAHETWALVKDSVLATSLYRQGHCSAAARLRGRGLPRAVT